MSADIRIEGAARRLFADTRRVAGSDGDVSHRWHSARKNPKPVLVGDRPWDRVGAFVYGTVLRDEGRLRLWYQARADAQAGNTHSVAYAESSDGVRWDKPALGAVDFEGSRANNLTDAVLHLPSVGRLGNGDLAAAGGPAYWMAGHAAAGAAMHGVNPGYPRRAMYLLHSNDGYRWRRAGGGDGRPLWDPDEVTVGGYGAGSDVNPVVYDAPRRRYIAAAKLHVPFEGHHRRSFAIRTSPDLRTWSAPRMALAPDAQDDQRACERGLHRADFYGLTFHPYPEFLLGFIWVFYMAAPPPEIEWPQPRRLYGWGREGHIAEIQLAFSYDGEYWQRPPGRPAFIASGERGKWDAGNVATANLPVLIGDEHFHYYGGGPIYHGATHRPPNPFRPAVGPFNATGLARIKRDRYASFSASVGGSLLVDHGRMDGRVLRVNARTPHGSVRAAVLDASGREVPGLGLSECRAFNGDDVDGIISWEAADLRAVPVGQEAAIRFVLEEADLFGYEVTG
ncbi:MAG: hypothetical protein HY332_15425 [Chloroflexi bacterium]|nr:hypothetical protein [Chloroflexota bacterium]